MKLTQKQKRLLKYIGVAGGVYLTFRYLLPLVLPFFIAYGLACGLAPATRWLEKHLRIPKGVGAAVILVVLCASFSALLLFLGRQLLFQLRELSERMPQYQEQANEWLNRLLTGVEKTFHLEDGIMLQQLSEMGMRALEQAKEGAMLYVASHGFNVLTWFIGFFTAFFVLLVAVILCVKELDHIWWLRDHSAFSKEIAVFRRPMVMVGKAYIRTQVIILCTVMSILITGLTIMKNRYAVLLGLLIGLLDALPLFGTGTVFIPWALVDVLLGNFGQAAALTTIYLICYFVREFMETKLMGDKTGMTPLETLISMYVGLQLFSLWGLFLGPIGWLLVKEAVQMGESEKNNKNL